MKMTEEKTNNPLSLYDWAGGLKAIEKWITQFYDKVVKDPLLELLFKDMDKEHQKNVALFLAEVFGGPQEYTKKRGGHATMLRHHLDKGISEKQRKRWVDLLLESADESACRMIRSSGRRLSLILSGEHGWRLLIPSLTKTRNWMNRCQNGGGAKLVGLTRKIRFRHDYRK